MAINQSVNEEKDSANYCVKAGKGMAGNKGMVIDDEALGQPVNYNCI